MKRINVLLGVVGVLAVGCGNGDDSGTSSNTDSGSPDATVEGGTSPDAQSEAASDTGTQGDVSADAPSTTTEGGASCTPFDAGALDDAAVAAGVQFILSTGHCTHCHQSDPDAGVILSGNSMSITDAGPVFPPNLTPDPATGLGCWSNDQIANAILFGVDPATDGGVLCHLMPEFGVGKGDAGPALDDASVVNVVEALRSLMPVSNQVPMTMCPATTSPSTPDAGDAGIDAAPADAASE
jgi:hypothetical protein